MPRIAFLLGDTRLSRHDNHLRLPAAFEGAGWDAARLPWTDLRLTPAGVRLGDHDPAGYDLIWPLGLGAAASFLDRMQLLRELPGERLVVSADAFTYWHAKYPWWSLMPETHASGDAAYLSSRLAAGGDWVVKPTAGSFGRDVRRIRDDGDGRRALAAATRDGRYALLQRYLPEAAQGEIRTLVAGGRRIGSYRRRPGPHGLANLAAGGVAEAGAPDAAAESLVTSLTEDLARRGVGFAAIDTVAGYLMEVNLANPGGLATLESLYGGSPERSVAEAVIAWRAQRG